MGKINPILIWLIFLVASIACRTQPEKKLLKFADYPDMQLGFSTQNFQAAMENNVQNLTEILEYASAEGYQFIELRDPQAKLSEEECSALAKVAGETKIDVIYEIHKNLLDTGFFKIFERGLKNTLIFPGPGILRTVVSGSEFKNNPAKKGWSKDEFLQLTKISDSCIKIAESNNVKFIVENFDEAFFGEDENYYGFADLLNKSPGTGLQLDMSNMFRKPARVMTEPREVMEYLSTLVNQWSTTHLKTVLVKGGDMQPVLTDNPITVEEIIKLMGKKNIKYAALELASVPDKQQCFKNHSLCVQFLKDKSLIK
jgi:sugar phosphate isomerase/epimerase